MFHRPRLAHHASPFLGDARTGASDVLDTKGNVSVTVSKVVSTGIPVMGEFQHRLISLGSISDEGQCESPTGVVLAAEKLHAQQLRVKGNGTL